MTDRSGPRVNGGGRCLWRSAILGDGRAVWWTACGTVYDGDSMRNLDSFCAYCGRRKGDQLNDWEEWGGYLRASKNVTQIVSVFVACTECGEEVSAADLPCPCGTGGAE